MYVLVYIVHTVLHGNSQVNLVLCLCCHNNRTPARVDSTKMNTKGEQRFIALVDAICVVSGTVMIYTSVPQSACFEARVDLIIEPSAMRKPIIIQERPGSASSPSATLRSPLAFRPI